MLAARLSMASVFVVMGAYRVFGAYQGVPTTGATLVFSSLALALGLLIAAGWKLRWTALAATALMLVDALMSHPFWSVAGADRGVQLLHFMKNISIAGGLLLLSLMSLSRQRY